MKTNYYIVDKFNQLVRTHARLGYPQSLSCEHSIDHADRFDSEHDANCALSYWQVNNDFDGRVIDATEARDLSAGHDEQLWAECESSNGIEN